MKQVILIGGKSGSGKNTVADIMYKHLVAKGKKVLALGNGDLVREYARKYFKLIDYKGSSEGRKIMMGITDMMYDLYPNYFDKITEEKINNSDADIVIIYDWRYPCTYEYLKANANLEVVTMYLHRRGYTYDKEVTKNKAEQLATLRPYINYNIYNNTMTLDTLTSCVQHCVEVIIHE